MKFTILPLTATLLAMPLPTLSSPTPQPSDLTYTSLLTVHPTLRSIRFRRSSNSTKSSIWVSRFQNYRLAHSANLTIEQNATLDRAIDIAATGDFSTSSYAALKDSAIHAFGFGEAKFLFTDLEDHDSSSNSSSSSSSEEKSKKGHTSSEDGGNTPSSTLSTGTPSSSSTGSLDPDTNQNLNLDFNIKRETTASTQNCACSTLDSWCGTGMQCIPQSSATGDLQKKKKRTFGSSDNLKNKDADTNTNAGGNTCTTLSESASASASTCAGCLFLGEVCDGVCVAVIGFDGDDDDEGDETFASATASVTASISASISATFASASASASVLATVTGDVSSSGEEN